MSDKYTEFLADLRDAQIRALACQVGIVGWMTSPAPKLYNELLDNDKAMQIHEEVYGV